MAVCGTAHYTEKTQRLQWFRKRSTLQFHYSAHNCALIKNLNFVLGTYRARATTALGANVLFLHPPPIPAAERTALDAAGGPHPNPAPALRERGEAGWWTRYRRQTLAQNRHCYARLPPSSLRGEEEGGQGKGEGRQVFSAAPTLQPLQPGHHTVRQRDAPISRQHRSGRLRRTPIRQWNGHRMCLMAAMRGGQ